MTWFKVDDGFADHPKVIELQASDHWKGALALWTLAGSWSSRHLTDGRVPTAAVHRLGCSREEAGALVAAGLWLVVEGGYQFHDWAERNPSRESVIADREATRERVQRHRTGKGLKSETLAKCGRSCHYCGTGLSLSSMTLDHQIPRKNGGRSGGDNVVAACLGCNSAKGAGTLVTAYVCVCTGVHERYEPESNATVTASRPVPSRPDPVLPKGSTFTREGSDRYSEAWIAREGLSPLDASRKYLTAGYQSRYESATGDAWMSAGANHSTLGTIAAWCAAAADWQARCDLVLDGVFADPYLADKSYPLGPVAKDPAKYAKVARDARGKAAKVERAAKAEREREARERERDAETERAAVKPTAEVKAFVARTNAAPGKRGGEPKSFAAVVSGAPTVVRSRELDATRQRLEAQAAELRSGMQKAEGE